VTDRVYVPRFDENPELPCYCRSGRSFGDCCGSLREDREPPKGVTVVHQFLPLPECRRLVRFADKQKGRWLMINDAEQSTPEKMVEKRDPDRVTQAVDMAKHQPFINELFSRGLRRYATPEYGVLDWFETPYLLRYKVGGIYAAHSDAEQAEPQTGRIYRAADRDVSALIYLNDDYQGGELRFTKLNYTLQPKAGDLVIFPSGMLFKHESRPVKVGRKYALVSWASLRASRKLFPQASHSPRIRL
jgi:predicted 2-oxoglutarate/Fe(II)-dependent dioxygenase YbiX